MRGFVPNEEEEEEGSAAVRDVIIRSEREVQNGQMLSISLSLEGVEQAPINES